MMQCVKKCLHLSLTCNRDDWVILRSHSHICGLKMDLKLQNVFRDFCSIKDSVSVWWHYVDKKHEVDFYFNLKKNDCMALLRPNVMHAFAYWSARLNKYKKFEYLGMHLLTVVCDFICLKLDEKRKCSDQKYIIRCWF